MAEPENDTDDVEDVKSLSLREQLSILFKASRAFWMVNLVNFGDGVTYFGILILLTVFIHDKVGFDDNLTHISYSLFTGAVTLFMLFGGMISDKIGVRKALTLALLLLVVGRTMLVGSPMVGAGAAAMLWTSLFVMASAEGIIQPALYAGVKEFTDPRTATIGYSFLYAIMNLGIFVEHAISPVVRGSQPGETDAGNIAAVFLTLIGVTVVFLFIHLFLFTKKTEERDRYITPEERKQDEDTRPFLARLKEMPFFDARLMFFIFILLPVRTLFAHQSLTLPQYIQRCLPDWFHRYELFQMINPGIIVIFVPLFAILTRKVSVIKMMIIGTMVSAVAPFLLVPGPNVLLLVCYVALFSLGEALWSSRFLEYVANLSPAGRVGAYMGIAGIPWFLAKSTTGFYSGRLLSHFVPEGGPHDSGSLWLVYACIACISPIGLILAKRWIDRGVLQPADAGSK